MLEATARYANGKCRRCDLIQDWKRGILGYPPGFPWATARKNGNRFIQASWNASALQLHSLMSAEMCCPVVVCINSLMLGTRRPFRTCRSNWTRIWSFSRNLLESSMGTYSIFLTSTGLISYEHELCVPWGHSGTCAYSACDSVVSHLTEYSTSFSITYNAAIYNDRIWYAFRANRQIGKQNTE